MDNVKNNTKILLDIKKAIDMLIMVELCKAGVGRDQAREILGTLDNNMFSKINVTLDKK